MSVTDGKSRNPFLSYCLNWMLWVSRKELSADKTKVNRKRQKLYKSVAQQLKR